MSTKKRKDEIISACEAQKTFCDAYLPVIEALAEIEEQKSKILREFKKKGNEFIVEFTNKAGASNMAKNPLLAEWDDLNKTALIFRRELGLTPAGQKKLQQGAGRPKKKNSPLEAVIRNLEQK